MFDDHEAECPTRREAERPEMGDLDDPRVSRQGERGCHRECGVQRGDDSGKRDADDDRHCHRGVAEGPAVLRPALDRRPRGNSGDRVANRWSGGLGRIEEHRGRDQLRLRMDRLELLA
jgi:hypothetical protein